LEVQALDGIACVLPGTSVTEGQLLISGVEDTETLGARVLTGMGTVEARTWYTLTADLPLTAPVKRYSGEERTFYSLVLGTRRIKFFSNSGMETGSYDKITTRDRLTFFGVPLPVTLEREICRYYEPQVTAVDVAAAETAAEEALTDYLHTLVDGYGTVSSTLCSSRQRGEVLTVTLTAECVEQIGRTAPIYTEEPDGDRP
jgi:similar to stage IV sporulation protein